MGRDPILTLLLRRSEEAIGAMVHRFGARLMSTALNILGIREDAEEAVSDTYYAVWNVVPPKEPDPLDPFVYRVGRNLALKRLRRNTAQKRNGSYDVSLEELEGCIPARTLEESFSARELGRAIDRFLGLQAQQMIPDTAAHGIGRKGSPFQGFHACKYIIGQLQRASSFRSNGAINCCLHDYRCIKIGCHPERSEAESKDPSPELYRMEWILRLRRLTAASLRMTYLLLLSNVNNNLPQHKPREGNPRSEAPGMEDHFVSGSGAK